MSLSVIQLRRAPVRTALLVAVVAALVFLVEYLATLSATLQAFSTGALAHLPADLIVYSGAAEGSLDASRLPPGIALRAARVRGVAGVAELGVADFTVADPGGRYELGLVGLGSGGPGWPPLVSGRLPGPAGVLADATEGAAGLGQGRRVVLEPGGVALRVTGVVSGVRYDGLVTAWTTFGTWARAVRAANPGGAAVPNALAVRARPGVRLAVLADRLAAALPGTKVLTRAAAVADVPGASVIAVTFDLLITVAFIAAVLVVSSVFLLLTVQRLRVWVLLRALGASAGRLGLAVLAQAAVVVVAGSAVASAALVLATAASGATFPLRAAPGLMAATVISVLIGACVSCLLPVRRIGRIDPADAVVRP
jgi:putative ABC transport system permease protein